MATKTDFTEDEWETIRKGVTGAGILVSIGDRDFTDTFGESGHWQSASRRSASRAGVSSSASSLLVDRAGSA